MGAWKRSIRTVGAVAASAGVLAIVLGLLVAAVRHTGGQVHDAIRRSVHVRPAPAPVAGRITER